MMANEVWVYDEFVGGGGGGHIYMRYVYIYMSCL